MLLFFNELLDESKSLLVLGYMVDIRTLESGLFPLKITPDGIFNAKGASDLEFFLDLIGMKNNLSARFTFKDESCTLGMCHSYP